MAYCTSPYAAKARGNAIKELIIERKSQNLIAKQAGVSRTTIWRWKKKWEAQNQHIQLTNDNRPHRQAGTVFRWQDVKWDIPTVVSAPHTHPNRISDDTVKRIIMLRKKLITVAQK